MSLLLFEGAAGTGKTTKLLAAARDHLAAFPLEVGQRVLALTKYHGSRRRMEIRLRGREGLGLRVDCMTLDSFAWRLVRRQRGLLRHQGAELVKADFQSITHAAGGLLGEASVASWVALRYPLVIVDEAQDAKGGEVRILAGLEPHARCICAADGFQDLSGDSENEALAWARRHGEVLSLDHVRRTEVPGLLAAARALRAGDRLTISHGSGFEICPTPKAAMAGGIVSWRIKSWSRYGEIAIVSPTRPGTSHFVDGLLSWVGANSARTKKSSATAGPWPVDWEAGDHELASELERALGIPADPDARLGCGDLAGAVGRLKASDLGEWLLRLEYVAGKSEVTVRELHEEIGNIVRRRRAYGPVKQRRRFALTIHQAKNREFESVIALWPLALKGNSEQQRRLLYNAVTRARGRVIVVVEDPKGTRLHGPLFMGGSP